MQSRTLDLYVASLGKYGDVVGTVEVGGVALVTGEMGGIFDVVFHKGQVVGGVTMCSNRALAERIALELAEGLQTD